MVRQPPGGSVAAAGTGDRRKRPASMHEFAIAAELVDAAVREAGARDARRITSLVCRVGLMRQVVAEMLVEAFRMASAGTLAEGARLEVETVAPATACLDCGWSGRTSEWTCRCPKCGSVRIRLEGGDELLLMSMELEVPDAG